MKCKWGLFILLITAVSIVGIYGKRKASRPALLTGMLGLSLTKEIGKSLCVQSVKKTLLTFLLTVTGAKLCQKATLWVEE